MLNISFSHHPSFLVNLTQVHAIQTQNTRSPATLELDPWVLLLSLVALAVGILIILLLRSELRQRRRTEVALRESEGRLQAIIQHSPVGMITVWNGVFLSTNPAFQQMVGYSEEELKGQAITAFTHPDDVANTDSCRLGLERGEYDHYQIEKRYIHKEGPIVWVSITVTLVCDDNGQPMFTFGIVENITERKRNEQLRRALLKIAEATNTTRDLDELFRSIHATVEELVPAQNFYIAIYNPKTEALRFPYFVDEFDEPPPDDEISLKGQKGLTAYLLRQGKPLLLRREEDAQFLESQGVISLGHPFLEWVGTPLKSVDGSIIGALVLQTYSPKVHFQETDKDLLAFVSDQVAMAIERKRSVDELRASEERYRTLVEISPDSVIMASVEGYIRFCNLRAARIFGYSSREEMQNATIYNLIAPEDRRQGFRDYRKALRGENVIDSRRIGQRKDGTTFPIEMSVSVLKDAAGQSNALIGYVNDITERVNHERERETVAILSSSMRMAGNRSEMMPILLDQLTKLLNAEGAAVAMIEPGTGDAVIELGGGAWAQYTGIRIPASKASKQRVFIYINNNASESPLVYMRDLAGDLTAVASVRLMAEDQEIGSLWIGRRTPWTENEGRVLMAIGDMAASAIRRTTLHEQTQRRLQQLQALRLIDEAIVTNYDLKDTLNTLVEKVTATLQVDAADILLTNPKTGHLDYAAGDGFRSAGWKKASLKYGEGQAGRAFAEQRVIYVPDLNEFLGQFGNPQLVIEDSFIAYYAVPLIARKQVLGVLEVFHRSPMKPDQEWIDFIQSLAGQAAIAIDNATLIENLKRSNEELSSAYETTLEGWVRALDLRDQETEGHSERVTEITIRLARTLGIPDDKLVHIRRGALLHDIGKLGIPDSILLKPGPLTEEEWVIMRKHPFYAYKMMEAVPYLHRALEIPYCHHERWDGSGYPRGLVRDEIPLPARVFAVVDVWDALISNRPYRPAWPVDKVLEYLQKYSGVHFDPVVVNEFLKVFRQG